MRDKFARPGYSGRKRSENLAPDSGTDYVTKRRHVIITYMN